MDVQFSEEQESLRDSARTLLERECPMQLVRDQFDDARGFPESLWRSMADLGWMGLRIPEEYGGSGLGAVDLALLLEEMGRALCPGPFVSTAVVGAQAILQGGNEAQRRQWLPPLVSGDLRLALAQVEEDANWGAEGIRLTLEEQGGDLTLSGRKCFVADAPSADLLVVAGRSAADPAHPSRGISLLLVDAHAPGVSIRTLDLVEQSRKVAEISFDDVTVPRESLLGALGEGWPLLERLHDHARVAACAELSGSAEKVLEMSVAYAKTREQFGQPIGRFQALQHKCADMLVASESIRSAAYYAAWALEQPDLDPHTTACLANAFCSEAYVKVAGDGIQIHGGLGFTWEQDLHLYFKHARAAELAFGSPSHQREIAAQVLVDGPGPGA